MHFFVYIPYKGGYTHVDTIMILMRV